jgi:NADPH:quinone reductase-like Zn-dependent oxidoreductase
LRLEQDDHLLIRGGTTSIGLAAAALAKGKCAFIAATTRKPERETDLKSNGADEVYIDTGNIVEEVKKRHPAGFNKVLELVGITTLKDSCQLTQPNGLVCMTGIAGGKWAYNSFNPFEVIPTSVGLTVYSGNEKRFMETPINEIAQLIVDGNLSIPTKVFNMDEIAEAHRAMDESNACGKIVVLT